MNDALHPVHKGPMTRFSGPQGQAVDAYVEHPDRPEQAARIIVIADPTMTPTSIRQVCRALAEEGFVAVAPALAATPDSSSVEYLDRTTNLIDNTLCRGSANTAVLSFERGARVALELARRRAVRCAIAYCDEEALLQAHDAQGPMQLHITGAAGACNAPGNDDSLQVFRYPTLAPGFAAPESPTFDALASSIAHSRMLGMLRPILGPRYDLARLFQEHLAQEFMHRDADATIATMVHQPYVNHVPTLTGGVGYDMLKRFYKYHFIPTQPNDRQVTLISETVSADTVVLEVINRFSHDARNDYLLPGLEPTGLQIEIPAVIVAKFRGDKLYREHIYWDQASVLVQLGLLNPAGLPVAGREQARKVANPAEPSNNLMPNWKDSAELPL